MICDAVFFKRVFRRQIYRIPFLPKFIQSVSDISMALMSNRTANYNKHQERIIFAKMAMTNSKLNVICRLKIGIDYGTMAKR